MKKSLSLFMACIMVFSLLAVPTFAADVDTNEPPIIPEEYAYFANAWAGLSPSSGNWYYVSGGAGSIHATMNIKVFLSLQKYGSSGWENIATWNGEGAFSASAGGERYISAKGTYRTKMYAEIYHQDGTLGETETVYSDLLYIR